MPSTALIEKRKEIEAKQKKLHEVFAQAGSDMDMAKVTVLEGDAKAKVEAIRKMNDELADLTKEAEQLADVERIAEETKIREAKMKDENQQDSEQLPGGYVPHPAGGQAKSIGELFTESNAYKAFKDRHQINETGQLKLSRPELKTLMTTAAGWAPESLRTGKFVEYATRPIQVIDTIPDGETSMAAIKYMEETTFTNNAAEVAEGGQYGEAALVLTERSVSVVKIGVWLPITDEQLEDVAQVQSYINQRLPFMLRQRLDSQLLVGDGTGANLTGILNTSNIQTQAKGEDPDPDAIYKGITKVRVTGRSVPNVVILHPNDWQAIRLLTANGIYVWGSPSEAGPERIWGLPILQTDAETETTGLVADMNIGCQLFWRRDIEMKITDAHSDFFIKGKQAIRADVRVAFPRYRPVAFCTVTGL